MLTGWRATCTVAKRFRHMHSIQQNIASIEVVCRVWIVILAAGYESVKDTNLRKLGNLDQISAHMLYNFTKTA